MKPLQANASLAERLVWQLQREALPQTTAGVWSKLRRDGNLQGFSLQEAEAAMEAEVRDGRVIRVVRNGMYLHTTP